MILLFVNIIFLIIHTKKLYKTTFIGITISFVYNLLIHAFVVDLPNKMCIKIKVYAIIKKLNLQ